MKKNVLRIAALFVTAAVLLVSCTKEKSQDVQITPQNEEAVLRAEADKAVGEQQQLVANFEKDFNTMLGNGNIALRGQQNIVTIAQSLPIFKSLVAAVVKTGLAGTLASTSINATVFAPTDAAFAKLPAPFNNAANISAITNVDQINALRNILLYHVLGSEVKRNQVAPGRSSAPTLKPVVIENDNRIYFSNSLGLLLVNGNSLVLLANVDASNGVIHVIDDVLLPPSQNIAQIAIGNPAFSSLVAALVKTNLAGVFTGTGDFTVFAPTDAAFAKLPAPFNNAANIGAISNPAQIAALANILKYHVSASRYFAWDLGILNSIPTLADAPSNRLIGILGLNGGWVKGKTNTSFSRVNPANILATNGVIQVIDQVLLP
jgi:uncharacterized surface protein with fasciclin (FAS1) repeats